MAFNHLHHNADSRNYNNVRAQVNRTKQRFLSIVILVTYAYARVKQIDPLLHLGPQTGSQMVLLSTSTQTELDP
jgi:hypothetical protein